jgi:hypothetical protein
MPIAASLIYCRASGTMWKNDFRLIASAALFIAALGSARGDSFMMHFEVTGFPVSNGNPPPTDPVTGTIVWEAAGIRDPIQSFDSISMTLDGHSYSVDEIGVPPPGYPITGGLIGGTTNQVYRVANYTDDFWIRWNTNSLTPFDFTYASSRRSGIWYVSINSAVNFTEFSITEVPEPSPDLLFGLGFLGTVAWRSRLREPWTLKDS